VEKNPENIYTQNDQQSSCKLEKNTFKLSQNNGIRTNIINTRKLFHNAAERQESLKKTFSNFQQSL